MRRRVSRLTLTARERSMVTSNEKVIKCYYGTYRKNLLDTKHKISIEVYSSRLEVCAFAEVDGLSKDTFANAIPYDKIIVVEEKTYNTHQGVFIEYIGDGLSRAARGIVLLGLENNGQWVDLINKTKFEFDEKKKKQQHLQNEYATQQKKLAQEKEVAAVKFYQDCLSFHIKNTEQPMYQLFSEKNKIAGIYIGEDKSLNFLKIDGYNREEVNNTIPYAELHYYEKAGNIHYVSDLNISQSTYGGSINGANISKLATVGGGLLFGLSGMALGAALTYKPGETVLPNTSFEASSTNRKIDERSVVLNFYSQEKKQFIDIELPLEIYNFLQTFLPEKKYSVVQELEKRTLADAALGLPDTKSVTLLESSQEDTHEADFAEFKRKVEKLKFMQDAGLLSDEEFNEQKQKLINSLG